MESISSAETKWDEIQLFDAIGMRLEEYLREKTGTVTILIELAHNSVSAYILEIRFILLSFKVENLYNVDISNRVKDRCADTLVGSEEGTLFLQNPGNEGRILKGYYLCALFNGIVLCGPHTCYFDPLILKV